MFGENFDITSPLNQLLRQQTCHIAADAYESSFGSVRRSQPRGMPLVASETIPRSVSETKNVVCGAVYFESVAELCF